MNYKQQPSSSFAAATDDLCGYVVKITFYNNENGYTIAQLKTPKQSEPCCIVGIMPALQPGETVRCIGTWKHHLIYGRQFEVRQINLEAPADIEGIKNYLGSGLIKGIGPVYAKRIVEKFGTDTLAVIDKTPEKLYEIEGLGKKTRQPDKHLLGCTEIYPSGDDISADTWHKPLLGTKGI